MDVKQVWMCEGRVFDTEEAALRWKARSAAKMVLAKLLEMNDLDERSFQPVLDVLFRNAKEVRDLLNGVLEMGTP